MSIRMFVLQLNIRFLLLMSTTTQKRREYTFQKVISLLQNISKAYGIIFAFFQRF